MNCLNAIVLGWASVGDTWHAFKIARKMPGIVSCATVGPDHRVGYLHLAPRGTIPAGAAVCSVCAAAA